MNAVPKMQIGRWLLGSVAVLVSLPLIASMADAQKRNRALAEQTALVQAEIDRIQRENEDIRLELEAIDNDPLYLRRLLTQMNMTQQNEKILKK
ncbi:MAG: hypothetical protein A2Z34_00735 [Planctomycetes bacterium RBG_16_59_8]|nr:MAG: hypothetical protein A2Z34_00735 [Planctomycetes bacterium RBG_16_59_8]